ncbi:hypothetical protein [Roseateles sp.]|uniref:hypothetical protein n=1 Tax=Roseateles sp. TaxID=1971397 RepID=UPI0031D21F93
MATWQKAKGWTKQRARRPAGRQREDYVTRIEHDAKNDALLQLVRADFAMLRSDFAGLRGDMLERFGKVDGEITGIKGEITGIRGQIDGLKGEIHGIKDTVEGLKSSLSSTQWFVGAAVALMALLPQLPSMIAAYRFPPPPRSASPAARPSLSAPEPAASGPRAQPVQG